MPNPIDPSTLAELKAKHGDVLHLETDLGDVVFKVATPELWQRFIDEVSDEDQRPRAMAPLVYGCRVYPEKEEFDRILQRRPGLTQTLGNQLSAFCGLEKAAARKK
jgi:hypothetical protein